MRDLIQLLPILVIVLAIVAVIRNAAKMVRKAGERTAVPRRAADFDPALAERTRRIQEEIRRKIAGRRGQTLAPEVAPVGPRMEPPVIYEEERTEAPVVTTATNAVLERQQQLADQMRALELARTTEQRRAAAVAGILNTGTKAAVGARSGMRVELLADLRDPAGLRRAFVLREMLGPPVGLRQRILD